MQKCPSCGFNNRPGVVFCENCGTSLLSGGSPLSTKALEADEQKDVDPGDQPPPSVVSSSTRTEIFPTGGTLRLEIEGSPEPIYLGLNHREIVLGRRDPATGALPDVDLTPFAGYRMGVSRRHSQIRHSEEGHLDVFDLGSSNGTFLNGRRLEAHYPYRLRDGDKLALGQIVIRVYFEKPAGEAEAVPAAPVTKGTGTKPLTGEPPKLDESKLPLAAQQAARPSDGAAKPPAPDKPTTVMSGSASPLQAQKTEEKAAQSPAVPVPSEPPKTDPQPSQPVEAKQPAAEKPVQAQPPSSASSPLGTASKPAEAKPKEAQPQTSASSPLGTASKPAEAKPEAEKPKLPTTEAPKSESANTSPPKKAEESGNNKEDEKEPSSKPDSSTKPSE
jgi:predicted component of type VI protein secretion system